MLVHANGEEGVMALYDPPSGWMPLVATDERTRDKLRPVAEDIGRQNGRPVKLLCFTARADDEIVFSGDA